VTTSGENAKGRYLAGPEPSGGRGAPRKACLAARRAPAPRPSASGTFEDLEWQKLLRQHEEELERLLAGQEGRPE
jgi:hypothetical protein